MFKITKCNIRCGVIRWQILSSIKVTERTFMLTLKMWVNVIASSYNRYNVATWQISTTIQVTTCIQIVCTF